MKHELLNQLSNLDIACRILVNSFNGDRDNPQSSTTVKEFLERESGVAANLRFLTEATVLQELKAMTIEQVWERHDATQETVDAFKSMEFF